MKIGTTYTFTWYDIPDCSIYLSRNNGNTWNPIALNVISVGEDVPLIGNYAWLVTEPESDNCLIKFVDNSDGSEYIGELFKITFNNYSVAMFNNKHKKRFKIRSGMFNTSIILI